jgi:hypothetical protein
MLETPVLLLIFNRPAETRRVFEAIQKAAPRKLYVAADGPRANKENEAALCEETRKVVSSFTGELHTLYRDNNLGCKNAVAEGITWFFNNVEQGIILEDDCLPDPTFFSFCEELLKKYKDDPRIMHISGNNFQFGRQRGNASYYFSRFPHIWGWASWRKAWAHYTISMDDYPQLRQEPEFKKYLDNRNLLMTYEGKINTWDSQWLCSVYRQKGYAALPNVNLVRNIGFESDNFTHTAEAPWWYKKINHGSIPVVTHPGKVEYNNKADLFTHDRIFLPLRKRIIKYFTNWWS